MQYIDANTTLTIDITGKPILQILWRNLCIFGETNPVASLM